MALPVRARLTIWYSAVLMLIVLALGSFLVLRLRNDLLRGLDSTLTTRAEQIALTIKGPGEGEFQDVGDAPRLAGIPRGDTAAQVLGTDGRLIEHSGETEVQTPLLGPRAVAAARVRPYRTTTAVGRDGEPYRVLGVALPSGSEVLVVAASQDPLDAAVRRLLLLLATSAPVAIGVSAAGGYLLARRALGPIDAMTRAAAAIGADDASRRLTVPGVQDEVGRLAQTLNQMLTRLQTGLEEQRRFAADASHELRTPLSIMAGEIDVALRTRDIAPDSQAVLDSLREEVTRMTALVDDLLTLARMDEGALRPVREHLDLLDVAKSVTERFANKASQAQVLLTVQGEPSWAYADKDQMIRVLSNLVDNALKHTPRLGRVHVSTGHQDGYVCLTVSDSGSGIPAEDIPHVFDRFYRVERARGRTEGGAGLGLAIGRSIVAAHGGTIDLASQEGIGTTVSIKLKDESGEA